MFSNSKRFLNLMIASLTIALFNNQFIFTGDIQHLIDHVTQSIEKAEALTSKITSDILKLQGFSSPRVRHFLNNICSLPNNRYMEVGVWQGSTFISALYKNQATILNAIAIDNWSEFDGAKKDFIDRTSFFIGQSNFNFFENDSFTLDLSKIKEKINIYFYDGNHSFEAQKKAFTYFDSAFDDVFIAIVDDYNWEQVQNGTQAAFRELNYNVLFERYLPSPANASIDSWWNGLYVAVISKN